MTNALEPTVTHHPASQAEELWVISDKVSVRANLPGTDLWIVDVEVPAGGGTPPHSHSFAEAFIIQEGYLLVWRRAGDGAEELVAHPGDVVTIPSNLAHGYRNPGAEPRGFRPLSLQPPWSSLKRSRAMHHGRDRLPTRCSPGWVK